MIAVLDAGPVIHLSWLNRLNLLEQQFEEVLVPRLYGMKCGSDGRWRIANQGPGFGPPRPRACRPRTRLSTLPLVVKTMGGAAG